MADPFAVKDCNLISIATGREAQNLRELSDRLETIHPGCIYYHFWGGMLRPTFDEPEYQNDFAAWAWRSLHDTYLAERLAIIDPTHFKDLEELRREILEVIEERLMQSEFVPWARAGQRFKFIRSQIVVFDTGIRMEHPKQLAGFIPRMSQGSIFYHFIDARRRTERGRSDFVEWLCSFEDKAYEGLAKQINRIDPYFTSLAHLRTEIESAFKVHTGEG